VVPCARGITPSLKVLCEDQVYAAGCTVEDGKTGSAIDTQKCHRLVFSVFPVVVVQRKPP